nr:hypothetical protein CFP56_51200 [Quercus suber]
MQKSSTSECTRCSREEDEELQRSTKKVKEVHNAAGAHDEPPPTAFGNTGKSFRDKLLGDILGAYEQAFDFKRDMETEYLSDTEAQVYPDGEAEVRLSGESKTRIRSQLSNALIIKVFGKSEPNFRPSRAFEALVAVWIRLPELSFEYYEGSVLREIGSVIGPVLRIDTHTASEARGQYARLCVQINLGKPLVRLLHIGKLDQPVLYEGLNTLCVSCGRVDHRTESCPYSVRSLEVEISTGEETEATGNHTQKWIATKGKGIGAAGDFGMEIREFRGFSAGGSSTATNQGSEERTTHLMDSGTIRMEEERTPLLDISNIPANPNLCKSIAGISSNFASAKLLKIRDCNSLEQEETHPVVLPTLQDQQNFDSEMVGVVCDTRSVLNVHHNADNRTDDVSEVGHLENGVDRMHVEGDGDTPLSS